MIKRIALIIFSLLLIFLSTTGTSAVVEITRVCDEANLLTLTETIQLREKLDAISETYGCDVVVATAKTLGDMNSEEYSDFVYELYGYGMGDTGSCIMLLICMEYRDYALTPYGDASKYFPLSTQEDMIDNFLPYLSDEDIYSAFSTFADDCEYEFEDYGKIKLKPAWILTSAVIGIIIALITVLIMKSQLRTVRFQPAANSYIKSGSLNITGRRDIFLYSTVSRTPKPKNNSSSGGGAGSAGTRSSGKF